MLLSDNLTSPGLELRTELATPGTVLEALCSPGRPLDGRNVLPGLVVARTVSMMQKTGSFAFRAALRTRSMFGTQSFASATARIRPQILPPSEMKSL
jgi:hypothetical protein